MPIHWSSHSLPELAHLTKAQRAQIEQKCSLNLFRFWRFRLFFGANVLILSLAIGAFFYRPFRSYGVWLEIFATYAFLILIRPLRISILRPYILAHLGTHCTHCLYDLSAHHPGQNCPECGTLIPMPQSTH